MDETWQGYWESHMAGVEAAERQLDARWLALLLLLRRKEREGRAAFRGLVFDLPTDDSGRFDTTDRRPFRQAHAGARRLATQLGGELIREVSGTTRSPFEFLDRGAFPRLGLMPQAFLRALESHNAAWRRTVELQIAAQRGQAHRRELSPGSPIPRLPAAPPILSLTQYRDPAIGKPISGIEVYPGITFAHERAILDEVAKIVQPGSTRDRARQDLFEIALDSMINVLRNARYEWDRIPEIIVRLTGRFGTRQDVFDYMAEAERGRNDLALRRELEEEARAARRRAEKAPRDEPPLPSAKTEKRTSGESLEDMQKRVAERVKREVRKRAERRAKEQAERSERHRKKEFQYTDHPRAHPSDYRVVRVDPRKILRETSKDPDYHVVRGAKNAKPERLDNASAFIKSGSDPIQRPLTVFTPGGDGSQISFVDGRHRFAALHELGARSVEIHLERSITPGQLKEFLKRFGA